MSVASPSRAAFPGSQAGRHPRLHFRGLLRLHSNYGPLDRSTAQGGLCHRASIHPVTRTNRLPATRSNRQLSGWFLPPLVIRAFWAHRELRAIGRQGEIGEFVKFLLHLDAEVEIAVGPHAAQAVVTLEDGAGDTDRPERPGTGQTGDARTDDRRRFDVRVSNDRRLCDAPTAGQREHGPQHQTDEPE